MAIRRPTGHAIAAGLILFASWTFVTWLLEGRIETLRRPDAVSDRLVYVVVANILIGMLGTFFVVVRLARRNVITCADAGFGSGTRTAIGVAAGALLGLALHVAQGAPTLDPVVMLNAFSQVLVVSIAEVLVCWSVLGAVMAAAFKPFGRIPAKGLAAVAASVLFGAYHFAHSAPFNTPTMVALLTAVGLVTSLFFFLSRDVYGTIVFHNFLGTFGVTEALRAGGALDAFAVPQWPLLATAMLAAAILIAADRLWLRPAVP